MSASACSSADVLARLDVLADRLRKAALARDFTAARQLDAELADGLVELGASLPRATAAERAAAARALEGVQSRHGAALAALEQARGETQAALSAARSGRRGAEAYLESATAERP